MDIFQDCYIWKEQPEVSVCRRCILPHLRCPTLPDLGLSPTPQIRPKRTFERSEAESQPYAPLTRWPGRPRLRVQESLSCLQPHVLHNEDLGWQQAVGVCMSWCALSNFWDKHHDQKQLGRDRVYLSWQFIVHHRGRSRQGPGGSNWSRDPCRWINKKSELMIHLHTGWKDLKKIERVDGSIPNFLCNCSRNINYSRVIHYSF